MYLPGLSDNIGIDTILYWYRNIVIILVLILVLILQNTSGWYWYWYWYCKTPWTDIGIGIDIGKTLRPILVLVLVKVKNEKERSVQWILLLFEKSMLRSWLNRYSYLLHFELDYFTGVKRFTPPNQLLHPFKTWSKGHTSTVYQILEGFNINWFRSTQCFTPRRCWPLFWSGSTIKVITISETFFI